MRHYIRPVWNEEGKEDELEVKLTDEAVPYFNYLIQDMKKSFCLP